VLVLVLVLERPVTVAVVEEGTGCYSARNYVGNRDGMMAPPLRAGAPADR